MTKIYRDRYVNIQRLSGSWLFGTLSTILQHFTHNETQWSTAARRCHFALRDGKVNISQHLAIPSPGSPRVTILLASPVRMLVYCVVKHRRPLTSSRPQMSASHLLGLQGPQQTTAHLCLFRKYKQHQIGKIHKFLTYARIKIIPRLFSEIWVVWMDVIKAMSNAWKQAVWHWNQNEKQPFY